MLWCQLNLSRQCSGQMQPKSASLTRRCRACCVPLRDQVVDMKQGDLFIVRYESVAALVQQGKAVLV